MDDYDKQLADYKEERDKDPALKRIGYVFSVLGVIAFLAALAYVLQRYGILHL